MLRYYQQEAVDAVFDFLRSKSGNPLVVLPTGAGKSHVIRSLLAGSVSRGKRAIVLCHRKELIEQNAKGVAGAGLYSAGLNRKQINEDVIFAGVQSAYKRALDFGRRHLVLIDEAHLAADEGMFEQFLSGLRSVNPDLRVVGLTATPYRTSEGHLTEGDTWDAVCYEVPVSRLIAEGFLSPLTSTPSNLYDTDSLRVRAGEFTESSLQLLFDDDKKIDAACHEVLSKTGNRRSVLVFCSGVTHAYHVAERLGGKVIHGETSPVERAGLIEAFRNGRLRFLCNCDVLTTGFDAPNVDAVVLLRATMSPGLLVQMAGRGFRLSEGKTDCLILDFGRNIERHGPLDAIDFGKRRAAASGSEATKKTCPGCDEEVAPAVRVCSCGFIFPKPELKHEVEASAAEPLAKPEVLNVSGWTFSRHDKKETPSLRVTYHCGVTDVSEWVCVMHEGPAGKKALSWVDKHCTEDFRDVWAAWRELYEGDAVDSLVASQKIFQCPSSITVIRDGKWFRVVGREFGEILQEEELPF